MIPSSLPTIPPLDTAAQQSIRDRQLTLTKPPHSLGRLEELSIQLAGIAGRTDFSVARRAVVVMAADHGVCAEGVSAFPQSVTAQMILNFLNGGAAVNVLARQFGARVAVVDVGVAADLPENLKLYSRKIRRGTANMCAGPAMSHDEAHAAINAGLEIAQIEYEKGLDVLACGEMGIGNTTASAAIVSVITGHSPAAITGRGTGVDDLGLERKRAAIDKAIALNRPDRSDAVDVLSKIGGLEIGALAGLMIGAASRRVPVVLDGFISGAAALLAAELSPDAKNYFIAAHQSVEPGHRIILEHLQLRPLLNLDLRLGEGTGALLALPLLEAATRIVAEMATFQSAGVSGKA